MNTIPYVVFSLAIFYFWWYYDPVRKQKRAYKRQRLDLREALKRKT